MQGAQVPVYRSEGSSHQESEELFVVAIDFGTSYTGYAFAWRSSFEKKPLDIYAMKIDESQVSVHALFYRTVKV